MKDLKNNIINFINNPSFNFELGKNWYINANKDLYKIINDLNLNHKINIYDASLICSILSPANSWKNNIKDTYNVLNHFFNNIEPADKYTTYGQNVFKAFKYLKERKEYRLFNAQYDLYQTTMNFSTNWINKNMKAKKTFNFYHNLSNPFFGGDYFTIDRHMLKILGIESKQVTSKQYDVYKDLFLSVLNELKINLIPSQFQAVLWCNYVYLNKGILHY